MITYPCPNPGLTIETRSRGLFLSTYQAILGVLIKRVPWAPFQYESYQYRDSHENNKTVLWPSYLYMMTSSNGNIFSVTGPSCGEFTGPGEFPTQRSVTRSFDVFFDLRLNKWLSKQPRGWWFEMLSWSLWRHCNDNGNPHTWIDSLYIETSPRSYGVFMLKIMDSVLKTKKRNIKTTFYFHKIFFPSYILWFTNITQTNF